MGLRFRKSFKVAPGVKINLGKKSSSVTFGGKGMHYTVNSKGKTTKSVDIPGTGIYYTESSGGGTKKETITPPPSVPNQEPQLQNKNENNKKRGCLFYILALFAACFALALYSFMWIPGIIATIYFAVKKFDPTVKRKRLITSIAVTLTSLLMFGWLGTASKVSSIQVEWGQDTYDINDITEIKVSVIPNSAEIEDLRISANQIADLNYKDGQAIITFKETGSASIFFTANGSVNSNTEKITVIDREAEQKRIEEEKKKEEERLKAEQEAEAERLKLQQEAAKKAEEERLKAEEAARIKAEQEAAAQAEAERIKAEQEAQAAAEQARLAQEQSVSQKTPPQSQEVSVWLSATGSKYHSIPDCGNMNPDTARQISLSEAQSLGYEPCKKCY